MNKKVKEKDVTAKKVTIDMIVDDISNGSRLGKKAAINAGILWGKDWINMTTKDAPRIKFSNKIVALKLVDFPDPVVARFKTKGYALLEPKHLDSTNPECVKIGDRVALSVAYIEYYKGAKLTELKASNPKLGKLVEARKIQVRGWATDAWRCLLNANRLVERAKKVGNARPKVANFKTRLGLAIEKYIVRPNMSSLARGDVTAFQTSEMKEAIAAFNKVLYPAHKGIDNGLTI